MPAGGAHCSDFSALVAVVQRGATVRAGKTYLGGGGGLVSGNLGSGTQTRPVPQKWDSPVSTAPRRQQEPPQRRGEGASLAQSGN